MTNDKTFAFIKQVNVSFCLTHGKSDSSRSLLGDHCINLLRAVYSAFFQADIMGLVEKKKGFGAAGAYVRVSFIQEMGHSFPPAYQARLRQEWTHQPPVTT